MIRRLRDFRPEVLKQDRFLLAILIAIGLLMITSLALFFMRQSVQEYLPEETPQAVVHNYILALNRGDFERAYGYLVEASDKPDYERFRLALLTSSVNLSQVSLQLGEARQSGEAASLSLTVIHSSGNPFQGAWEETSQAVLVRSEAGEWKIQSLPYPFWSFDWYDTSPGPVR
jgi:hypothetical protein